MSEIIDFSKICRLCLSKDEEQFSVFEKSYIDEYTFADMINICLNIQITSNDILPTKICQNCLSIIDQTFTFRQKCLETEQYLQEKIQTSFVDAPTAQPMMDDNILILDSDDDYDKPESILTDTNAMYAINNAGTGNLQEQDNIFDDKGCQNVYTDFTCHICNFPFDGYSELAKHALEHAEKLTSNSKPFQCGCCGWKTFRKYSLQRHLQSHQKNPLYVCITCDKRFSKQTVYKQHKEICNT